MNMCFDQLDGQGNEPTLPQQKPRVIFYKNKGKHKKFSKRNTFSNVGKRRAGSYIFSKKSKERRNADLVNPVRPNSRNSYTFNKLSQDTKTKMSKIKPNVISFRYCSGKDSVCNRKGSIKSSKPMFIANNCSKIDGGTPIYTKPPSVKNAANFKTLGNDYTEFLNESNIRVKTPSLKNLCCVGNNSQINPRAKSQQGYRSFQQRVVKSRAINKSNIRVKNGKIVFNVSIGNQGINKRNKRLAKRPENSLKPSKTYLIQKGSYIRCRSKESLKAENDLQETQIPQKVKNPVRPKVAKKEIVPPAKMTLFSFKMPNCVNKENEPVHNQSFQVQPVKKLLPQKELGMADYSKRVKSKYLVNYRRMVKNDKENKYKLRDKIESKEFIAVEIKKKREQQSNSIENLDLKEIGSSNSFFR
ncbi:unnamed protein product [Moneuplotes crassus]|uniref:Uncharacterized protein n=1 Tax=Euplotes crassus TaxID=5936 RepID=A0AAD1U816_EUPCR|nr:unnamed protein product [Moneuplotes crassus]